MKITPFHDKHLAAGGRMVEFAGYHLPLQFRGIIPEHHRVRSTVGVFDVSHMGRIEVWGRDAQKFLNLMTTNDVTKLSVNQAQYSVLCYPDGGIVDDLVVYRLADHYLLVVNGANHFKDLDWLRQNLFGDVRLEDVTDRIAQLAIQGPEAEPVMQKICSTQLGQVAFYWAAQTEVAGVAALISRTGYTGEDGFELYLPAEHAVRIWDEIMAAGRDFSIEPVGLGARDTLRLEMKYCLYGNDIDQTTNPLEAGLGFVVKLDKPDGFIGSEALRRVAQDKPGRRLVCLEMVDNSIPRPHYDIYNGTEKVGQVTSGTLSPSLNKGIALGYVRHDCSQPGTSLTVEVRGKRAPAVVVKPPFYKHGSRK
ncbi:MAG: glycine cleavage system aminomethyltransferase GcvT [candidate division WOR-3 bacterium]